MNKDRQQRGFSLLEMVIVIAITMIMSAVALFTITNVLKSQRTDAALQLMLKQTRSARQLAIDRRRIYTVQYVAPATIYTTAGACGTNSTTATKTNFAGQVQYVNVSAAGSAPDGLGTATNAIDLDRGGSGLTDTICFYPDGSSRDTTGAVNSGVVYLTFPSTVEPSANVRLSNARAMSVFGPTGRIAGWQLFKTSAGGWFWREQ